jgi:serine/threonine-protein kinase HipA
VISEESSECFVYIMLPRETQSVTAGKFVLTKDRRGNSLGRFVYGDKYLLRSNAVEIDPIELKLAKRTYETVRLGGIFGALRDAGPDYWGRRVIEKHAGKAQLGELDYLLESPDDRAGALGFGSGKEPPAPKRKFNKTIDLAKLQQLAEALIRDEIDQADHFSIQVQELMLLGTSVGGARPKAVVEDDVGLWIAKFSRPDDRWNNPRVEHAMLELARQCGINAARSRIENIAGQDVLMVQRFDREKTSRGYVRARMISGLTLLRAEDSTQKRERWSYVVMSEELRRVVGEPKRDAAELFRRMCFNALISNIDDHPRNHSLIAIDKMWKLSPAYDLTPSPVISAERRDLAMTCGDQGRFANRENLLSQCTRFLLEREEAERTISSMQDQIQSTWFNVVRSCGVSAKDAETIRRAFAYDGFVQRQDVRE